MTSRSTGILVKTLVIGLVVGGVILFFVFDLHRQVSLEALKTRQEMLSLYTAQHTLLTLLVYAAIYIVMAALSLPGAAVMTMAGGALFGFWIGSAAALVSSTLGATLAFLIARFVLGNFIQKRFAERLKKINDGVRRALARILDRRVFVPPHPQHVVALGAALTPARRS